MVPANGHAAAERTTACTFGTRSVCQMRHMEIIENHRETLCFQCAPWVRQFCHDDVLCSKGQHVCMCGMHDSAAS